MEPMDLHVRRERLVNVPAPRFYEAVSCWLSRLALSQGADIRDLLRFLGVATKGDIDRQLHGNSLKALRDICGLPQTALAVHERVMVGLESMREVGARYLVTSQGGRPRFRFCPLCIASMRTPYFPIHWRFVAWRWCPDHDCLLEDVCPHCGGEIAFPADIALSVAGKLGYGFLNRCLLCGAHLSEIEPCHLDVSGFRRVSEMEEMSLRNGRALLATLYYGRFQIEGRPGWLHPKKFRDVERCGVLPVRFDWLRPALVRRRSDEGLPPECRRWSNGIGVLPGQGLGALHRR
jgi:hypothetical protein